MNTNISLSGDCTIANAAFQCVGAYSDGQWGMQASWTSGKESLSPGDLFAAIFGISFDPTDILPTVNLTSVKAALTPDASFSFSCNSSVNWPAPFGIPLGLSIQDLGFTFQYTKGQPSKTRATGTVAVDGSSVDILCYFSGASPDFILVNQIPALSLNSIFTQFFDLTPPADFIDLKFQNNQIYYLANGGSTAHLPALPTAIVPGLNISSQVTLKLADVIFPAIDLNINVASGNGISLSGSFEQNIDLAGFLVLTGTDTGNTKGPTLVIDSRNGQTIFRLNCGLQFLGENFGQAGITIAKQSENTVLSATLSSSKMPAPFSNLQLSMVYSNPDGFQITNWPGVTLQNLALDFATLLSEVNNNIANCGQIVNLEFNKTVQNSFTVNPTFTTRNPNIAGVEPGQFYIVLNGYYTLSAAGIVICSLPLPTLALSFAAPSDFDFNTIVETIGAAIVSNGVAVAQQLYNNKAALAQFILVFAGQAAAKNIANQLCTELQNSLNSFLRALTSEGAGILGSLGAAATALASTPCGAPSGAGGGGNSPNIKPLQSPSITSSQLIGNSWTVNWNSVTDTNYYEVQVFDGKGRNAGGVQFLQGSQATCILADLSSAPYTFQLIAWANPGLNYNSSPASIQLMQLNAVAEVTTHINYQSAQLSCLFQAVENATGYAAVLSSNSGVVLAQSANYTTKATGQIEFDFLVLGLNPFPCQYTIGITCTGGGQYIPSRQYVSPVLPLNWGVGFTEVGYTFNIS